MVADTNLKTNSWQGEEGIVALDRSLQIMSCNSPGERLLGLNLRPGTVLPLECIWSGAELKQMKRALAVTLQTGQQKHLSCILLSGTSQSPLKCDCGINPLFDRPDRIIGLILSIQPVGLSTAADAAGCPQLHENSRNIELLESLPEGVFTIDTDWRIDAFNTRAEEITGFKREEVIGRHCREIFRSDLCRLGCPLQIALKTGKTHVDQDVRILKKYGERQTILVNTGVLRDARGAITGAVETFRPLIGECISRKYIGKSKSFGAIVGQSEPMRRIFKLLPDIAASDANVFISGESGTGKDLIARTIHENSSRKHHRFVAVICSALAESLLESELFGHEKAAFTGATGARTGRFEMARGGSIFLDEIGELKPELQIKLLRVLEQHEFERVGGTRSLPMEARIISATNRDIHQAIREGHFREDFYYRLRTVPLHIPPLRERAEDIPLLVAYFVKQLNLRYKKRVMSVHPNIMRQFMQYSWPGNIRELERTLEHAYVFVKGPVILPRDLPAIEEFQPLKVKQRAPANLERNRPDRTSISRALAKAGGNRMAAAELLGVSRTTLWRHMKRLGIKGLMFQ